MRRLIQLHLVAALACVALSEPPLEWTSLHVRWSMYSWFSYKMSSAFFSLPLSESEAMKEGWKQAESDFTTTTWCMKNDPRVCILLDQKGSIAGVQVGIPAKDIMFPDNPYPVLKHPYFNNMTLFGTDIFAGRYYFVDQQTLEKGGRSNPTNLGTGLWLKSGDEMISVPLTASDLESAQWSRENCISMMGRHYYYDINPLKECEEMEPYFLLLDNKKNYVHGIGFQTFGTASHSKRKWFESVPSSAVKLTIPDAPQCLTDWASKYGIISLHMYFVDNPWFIMC